MIAILYSLLFVSLLYFYRRKNGNCVGTWLLLWYAIASLLTVWEYYTTPINSTYLDFTACVYYAACQILALIPFLILGKYDCSRFLFNRELFRYLSFVLILFGFIKLATSVTELYRNIGILFGNIEEIRYAFYDSLLESQNKSAFDKLMIIINNFQFMSPFLAFYFLCKGEGKMALCLFIASLGMPVGQMTHGEREGALKYIVNLYFCYKFFSPSLTEVVRNRVKKLGVQILTPFIIFIVAMTLGRFAGAGNRGVTNSLFLYGGDQPFFFTTLFNDQNIISQIQGGRVNFQYFFPAIERVQGQINMYINSDLYLNQFGGLPGSMFLDFGYYAIVVIGLFSLMYYTIIRKAIKKSMYLPLHITFLFYFSFQVLYMNIYYFDFCSLFSILFSLVFFIVCYFYKGNDKLQARNLNIINK